MHASQHQVSPIRRLLVLLLALSAIQSAAAQTFTVLYSFNASGNLSDGGWPEGGVTRDTAGNLYGTTFYGGSGTGCDIYYNGCGTVFKIDTSGVETVLHSFSGAGDGWNPTARVILDSAGNIYGTTWLGGAYSFGAVFKLDSSGTVTVLHNFAGGSDGANPMAAPVLDAAGNMYGVTSAGGPYFGIVYMIDTSGNESVLYRFTGGSDGAYPYSHLLVDAAGNLYGTVSQSGPAGAGTVFELSGSSLTTLYGFLGSNDGSIPMGGLITDTTGNFYGTTVQAGANGWGTVFEVQP